MKHIALALFLSGIISSAFAQNWVTSAPNIYYNSGNVGIGTATPGAALDVNGNQRLNGNLTFLNDQTVYFIHGPANGGAIRIRSNAGAASDRDLQFGIIDNAGTWYSAMTVGNNGNIGIGTTSPGYKLEVAGGIGTRGAMGNGSTGQYYEVAPYEIASHNNAGWAGTMIGVRSGGMNGSSIPVTQNVLANSTAYQQAWAMTFGTDKSQANGAALSVWTGDATNAGTVMSELFRIRYDGNVGIGTTNPGTYKLAVNGGIHSQSVNVDLTGWSDYVFKKEYQLPTLTEVKTYIDQNHHLPDMPSEAQVIKEGINLGEMNKLLTKKVEELTLYLIKKDEQITKQQEQIDELTEQLKSVIKRLPKN